jgi:hypothetical protein
MARVTKKNTDGAQASSVTAVVDTAPAVQPNTPVAVDVPTPENTPVPGGGSWRWSDTAPHWLPNTPD